MNSIKIFFVLLLFISLSFAQEKHDIITDRPDQTESSKSVLKGIFQVETGVQFFQVDGKKSINYLNTLLRYGILKKQNCA